MSVCVKTFVTTMLLLAHMVGSREAFANDESTDDIAEGPLIMHVGKNVHHAPSMATLHRAWNYSRGSKSSQEWLHDEYGEKHVIYLDIPQTSYSLLVIDGALTPLLSRSGPYEIWRIEGLDELVPHASVIRIDDAKATLIVPGGDMRSILVLDFNDGLQLRYDEEYDGF